MTKNKKNRIILLILGVLIFAVIIILITQMGKKESEDKVKIGFVMSGRMEETGWNGMHYTGVKGACEKLGAELLVKENVKEFSGECEVAIAELVKDGATMIILSSYGYSEEVKDVVKDYPQITFYVNSSEYHDKNMTSYFVRMYQVRYLSGVLAGMKTTTNEIGYVAAMENNEVNRGISAFALGVKSVNPNAEVIVSWTGEWDNKEKEKEAARRLIENKNIDVITYHQNQPHVVEIAEEAGIASIGYHEKVEVFSENYLTAVVCDWELLYQELIKEFLQGKGNAEDNYWIGLEKGIVRLEGYSDKVTSEEREQIGKAKSKILSGKDVFSGEIYDSNGTLRCSENETISDEILLEQFDWHTKGVVIYEE